MEAKKIDIDRLAGNVGQIPGVPANPRRWGADEIGNLARSIEETPELLEARGCIVFPFEGQYVVLGGNMRLEACRHLGMGEIPCVILPATLPVEKLREIVIKDNGAFGRWDEEALLAEWGDLPLGDWGVPELGDALSPVEPEQMDALDDDFDETKEDIPCRVEMGDVWTCGAHRVMCGDATSEDDIKTLMGGGGGGPLSHGPSVQRGL